MTSGRVTKCAPMSIRDDCTADVPNWLAVAAATHERNVNSACIHSVLMLGVSMDACVYVLCMHVHTLYLLTFLISLISMNALVLHVDACLHHLVLVYRACVQRYQMHVHPFHCIVQY